MGIFSKWKKNSEPEYLNQDYNELDNIYHDYDIAIGKELTKGSEDWKETVYSGEDETFIMIHRKGVIHYFNMVGNKFNLAEAYSYSDEYNSGLFLNGVDGVEFGDDYDGYVDYISLNPDVRERLQEIYHDLTLMNLVKFDSYLMSDESGYRAETQLITEQSMLDRCENFDYFKADHENALHLLNKEKNNFSEILQSMDILDPQKFSDCRIRLVGEVDPVGIADRYVLTQALETKSIQDLISGTDSITLSKIFTALSNGLNNADYDIFDTKIEPLEPVVPEEEPEIIEEDDSEILEEYDPELDNPEIGEPIGESTTVVDDTEDPDEDETFLVELDYPQPSSFDLDEDDTGEDNAHSFSEDFDESENNFMDEYDNSEIPRKYFTDHVDDDLRIDVDDYLTENNVDDETIEAIMDFLEENFEMECELIDVENKIEREMIEYNSRLNDFHNLKIENELENLSVDLADVNEVLRDCDDDSLIIHEKRDKTDKSFFHIHEFEEKRCEINANRRSILMDVITLLPAEDENISSRIEKKIQGIDEVEYFAYHKLSTSEIIPMLDFDDEDYIEFGVEEEPENKSNGIDWEKGYVELDTPIFNVLVQKFGFNPIKDYIDLMNEKNAVGK